MQRQRRRELHRHGILQPAFTHDVDGCYLDCSFVCTSTGIDDGEANHQNTNDNTSKMSETTASCLPIAMKCDLANFGHLWLAGVATVCPSTTLARWISTQATSEQPKLK